MMVINIVITNVITIKNQQSKGYEYRPDFYYAWEEWNRSGISE